MNGKQFDVRVAALDEPDTAAKPRRATRKARSAQLKQQVDGIISPLQGTLREVRVETGQRVEEGAVLFIVEAMKMENEIKAPHTGIIDTINFMAGVTVEAGSVLATYKAAS